MYIFIHRMLFQVLIWQIFSPSLPFVFSLLTIASAEQSFVIFIPEGCAAAAIHVQLTPIPRASPARSCWHGSTYSITGGSWGTGAAATMGMAGAPGLPAPAPHSWLLVLLGLVLDALFPSYNILL